MTSYLFGGNNPRPSSYGATTTILTPCTSWYGHKFEKFDDKSIFCPTCGTTKSVGGTK
jgi:hypothetical protein